MQGLILTQRVSPRVPLQTNREIPHFAIDDVVKIRSNLDLLKTLQKNHGGFNEDMVEVLVSPCILEYIERIWYALDLDCVSGSYLNATQAS